jgi:DNA end-binding protein Ku
LRAPALSRQERKEAGMAARPTWQGHLRLSLVTCPVALYTATSRASEVSFHLINPETDNRIRMVATDPDAGPVERGKLVKGYEFEKNQYVIVTDEDLESVKVESSKVIDIERFVDERDIDRLYWNDPYYLAPSGKMAAEAFAVIREAMQQSGRLAIGRIGLHARERLMALEPRAPGIVAYTLRSHDEVRRPETVFDEIFEVQPDAGMVEIALKIIDQLSGPFEPEAFQDRYEAALKDLIQAKLKGKGVRVTAPEPEDTRAQDLMEMLRRSLTTAAPSRRPPSPSEAPERPRAKPAPKRRATGARRPR